MFSVEPGAEESSEKLYQNEERYEKHFGVIFPTEEFSHVLKGNGYDHSIEGMENLSEYIQKCIDKNTPASIPEGYEERLY